MATRQDKKVAAYVTIFKQLEVLDKKSFWRSIAYLVGENESLLLKFIGQKLHPTPSGDGMKNNAFGKNINNNFPKKIVSEDIAWFLDKKMSSIPFVTGKTRPSFNILLNCQHVVRASYMRCVKEEKSGKSEAESKSRNESDLSKMAVFLQLLLPKLYKEFKLCSSKLEKKLEDANHGPSKILEEKYLRHLDEKITRKEIEILLLVGIKMENVK